MKLDPALEVYPAHDYKGRSHTTIADELAGNPRLQKRERAEFVDMMRHLNLTAPDHITEALRTNMSGGKTVAQMLSEARSQGRIGKVSADPLLPIRAFHDIGGSGGVADAYTIWIVQWVGQELRADFQHLRRWRKSVEQAQSFTFKAAISIIVTGFVGAVWLGVKVMLGK